MDDIASTFADNSEEFFAHLLGSELLGRIAVGIVILVLTLWVAHALIRFIDHMMEVNESAFVNVSFFDNVIRWILYGIGLCAILDASFGVDMSTFIAALGIGGLALSLGAQDTLKNLIGGATIMFAKVFKPGDNIVIGGQTGVVKDISWRQTTIVTRAGDVVLVPNSNVTTSSVVVTSPVEKAIVYFVVANDRDLDEVAAEMKKAMAEAVAPIVGIEGEPGVLFLEISEYGARGKAFLFIQDATKINEAIDAMTRAINPIVR